MVFCNATIGRNSWCVIDGGDGEIDGAGIAGEAAVIGLVGETVGAVVVAGRCVGSGAVGVEAEAAMLRSSDQAIGQGIALDIAGGDTAMEDGVLGDARRGIAGHRRVIDGGDGEIDGAGIAGEAAVIGLVGETVGAVVVAGRCVEVGSAACRERVGIPGVG